MRRLKAPTESDHTLAPSTAAVRRLLPVEFLRKRKYDIGEVVAQGGMGAILDAREVTSGRTVAAPSKTFPCCRRCSVQRSGAG